MYNMALFTDEQLKVMSREYSLRGKAAKAELDRRSSRKIPVTRKATPSVTPEVTPEASQEVPKDVDDKPKRRRRNSRKKPVDE